LGYNPHYHSEERKQTTITKTAIHKQTINLNVVKKTTPFPTKKNQMPAPTTIGAFVSTSVLFCS
jgi:hypothetical protein